MWWKFKKGEPKGKLRVERVQVCWYDMERQGDCFDEDWIMPTENSMETLEKIGRVLPYVGTGNSRVFIHMDNSDVYEVLMKKLSNEQQRECNNFYGGRDNAEQDRKIT